MSINKSEKKRPVDYSLAGAGYMRLFAEVAEVD